MSRTTSWVRRGDQLWPTLHSATMLPPRSRFAVLTLRSIRLPCVRSVSDLNSSGAVLQKEILEEIALGLVVLFELVDDVRDATAELGGVGIAQHRCPLLGGRNGVPQLSVCGFERVHTEPEERALCADGVQVAAALFRVEISREMIGDSRQCVACAERPRGNAAPLQRDADLTQRRDRRRERIRVRE